MISPSMTWAFLARSPGSMRNPVSKARLPRITATDGSTQVTICVVVSGRGVVFGLSSGVYRLGGP